MRYETIGDFDHLNLPMPGDIEADVEITEVLPDGSVGCIQWAWNRVPVCLDLFRAGRGWGIQVKWGDEILHRGDRVSSPTLALARARAELHRLVSDLQVLVPSRKRE